ncbi:MAG: gamma-glutamylcyclotransferase [Actinobacteria bacterium]|nr:gamma-glutamylcyclotransferase [Actinomycetota bacterium]
MSTSPGLYAAYGSNMHPEQMLARCPQSPAAGIGWLTGWRLSFGGEEEFGWEGALATIVPDHGSRVFVALYELSPFDAESLDRWEFADSGVYRKIHVRVDAPDAPAAQNGSVLALVYVLNSYEGGLPSARTIGLLAEAAEAAGAPDEYINDLRGRPCKSVGL